MARPRSALYRSTGNGFGVEPVAVLDGDVDHLDLPSVPGTRRYLLGSVVDGELALLHPVADVEEGDDNRRSAPTTAR